MREEKPKEKVVEIEIAPRTRSTRRSQKEEEKMDLDGAEMEGSYDAVKPLAGLKIVASGEF